MAKKRVVLRMAVGEEHAVRLRELPTTDADVLKYTVETRWQSDYGKTFYWSTCYFGKSKHNALRMFKSIAKEFYEYL